MVFTAKLTREQFVGWLGRTHQPAPRKTSNVHPADLGRGGDVLLVWNEKPELENSDELQPIICVPKRGMREFFAFVSTYVSNYQPFSSFFRVVPIEMINQIVRDTPDRKLRSFPNLLVGAIIAEARLQSGDRVKRPSDLSIQGCLATMSSCAVSAFLAGFDRDQLELLMTSWSKTKSWFSEEPLRVEGDRIRQFWELVSTVYEDLPLNRVYTDEISRKILQFLIAITVSRGDDDPETWVYLSDGLPAAQRAFNRMRDSREDRVRAMDEVMAEAIAKDAIDARIREVVIGYLASRVAEGSLTYLQLLEPIEMKLPIAVLWFGLFSSLRRDTDVLVAGECLGRRVARHLTRSLHPFDPPTADVSIDELEIMMTEKRSGPRIRTEHQGSITVEVFPLISAVFRLPREARTGPAERDNLVQSEGISELRRLIERAGQIVDTLSESGQRSLFRNRWTRTPPSQRPRRDDK